MSLWGVEITCVLSSCGAACLLLPSGLAQTNLTTNEPTVAGACRDVVGLTHLLGGGCPLFCFSRSAKLQ
jgi:hypothetical protein